MCKSLKLFILFMTLLFSSEATHTEAIITSDSDTMNIKIKAQIEAVLHKSCFSQNYLFKTFALIPFGQYYLYRHAKGFDQISLKIQSFFNRFFWHQRRSKKRALKTARLSIKLFIIRVVQRHRHKCLRTYATQPQNRCRYIRILRS